MKAVSSTKAASKLSVSAIAAVLTWSRTSLLAVVLLAASDRTMAAAGVAPKLFGTLTWQKIAPSGSSVASLRNCQTFAWTGAKLTAWTNVSPGSVTVSGVSQIA